MSLASFPLKKGGRGSGGGEGSLVSLFTTGATIRIVRALVARVTRAVVSLGFVTPSAAALGVTPYQLLQ